MSQIVLNLKPSKNTYHNKQYVVYQNKGINAWILKEKYTNKTLGTARYLADLTAKFNIKLTDEKPSGAIGVEHITCEKMHTMSPANIQMIAAELNDWPRTRLTALRSVLAGNTNSGSNEFWQARNWLGDKVSATNHKRSFALNINVTLTVHDWVKVALNIVLRDHMLKGKTLQPLTHQHIKVIIREHVATIDPSTYDILKEMVAEIVEHGGLATISARQAVAADKLQLLDAQLRDYLAQVNILEEEVSMAVVYVLNEIMNPPYDHDAAVKEDFKLIERRFLNLRASERQAVVNLAHAYESDKVTEREVNALNVMDNTQFTWSPLCELRLYRASHHPVNRSMFLGLFHDLTAKHENTREFNKFVAEVLSKLTTFPWCPATLPASLQLTLLTLDGNALRDLVTTCHHLENNCDMTWAELAALSPFEIEKMANAAYDTYNSSKSKLERFYQSFTTIAKVAEQLVRDHGVIPTDSPTDLTESANTAAIRMIITAMRNGLMQQYEATYNGPQSGYNDIEDVPLSNAQPSYSKDLIAEVIRNLGAAGHYQFFKYMSEAVKLKVQDLNALNQIGKGVAEVLFPTANTELMLKVVEQVSRAYFGHKSILQPKPVEVIEFFNDTWALVDRFYPAGIDFGSDETSAMYDNTDVQRLIEFRSFRSQPPMETDFTAEIIDSAPPRSDLTVELFRQGHKPALELNGSAGPVGRAGMTVRDPSAFIAQFDVRQANADQETIHNINAFLDDDDWMKSNGKWDLVRRIFSVEFHADVVPGTSLNNVILAIEKCGWEVSTSTGGIFRLEAHTQ